MHVYRINNTLEVCEQLYTFITLAQTCRKQNMQLVIAFNSTVTIINQHW